MLAVNRSYGTSGLSATPILLLRAQEEQAQLQQQVQHGSPHVLSHTPSGLPLSYTVSPDDGKLSTKLNFESRTPQADAGEVARDVAEGDAAEARVQAQRLKEQQELQQQQQQQQRSVREASPAHEGGFVFLRPRIFAHAPRCARKNQGQGQGQGARDRDREAEGGRKGGRESYRAHIFAETETELREGGRGRESHTRTVEMPVCVCERERERGPYNRGRQTVLIGWASCLAGVSSQ